MLKKASNVVGDYKGRTLTNWNTKNVMGAATWSEYILVYEVKYSKFKAIETFRMIKENDSIKILGYNINSEGFIK